MSDELRAAAERFDVWSFLRDVLRRGAAIDHGCTASGEGYEVYSARLDAAARRLADQLRPHLADRPADDAEPVTEEWLRVVSPGPFRNGVGWPIACDATGGPVLYCVCTPGVPFDWYLCGHNRLLGLPDQPTRGHVRRLLITLGITPTPKG